MRDNCCLLCSRLDGATSQRSWFGKSEMLLCTHSNLVCSGGLERWTGLRCDVKAATCDCRQEEFTSQKKHEEEQGKATVRMSAMPTMRLYFRTLKEKQRSARKTFQGGGDIAK